MHSSSLWRPLLLIGVSQLISPTSACWNSSSKAGPQILTSNTRLFQLERLERELATMLEDLIDRSSHLVASWVQDFVKDVRQNYDRHSRWYWRPNDPVYSSLPTNRFLIIRRFARQWPLILAKLERMRKKSQNIRWFFADFEELLYQLDSPHDGIDDSVLHCVIHALNLIHIFHSEEIDFEKGIMRKMNRTLVRRMESLNPRDILDVALSLTEAPNNDGWSHATAAHWLYLSAKRAQDKTVMEMAEKDSEGYNKLMEIAHRHPCRLPETTARTGKLLTCHYFYIKGLYVRFRHEMLSEERPMITLIHDLLPKHAASGILDTVKPGLQPGTPMRTKEELKPTFHPQRRVAQTALLGAWSEWHHWYHMRIYLATGIKRDPLADSAGCGDHWSEVSVYGPGGYHSAHTDYFPLDAPLKVEGMCQDSGNRIVSFTSFLKIPGHGGNIAFEHLGVAVAPKQGSGLLWLNGDNGVMLQNTRHWQCPIVYGELATVTQWFRQDSINVEI